MNHQLTLPGTDTGLGAFGLGCTNAGNGWKGAQADRLLDFFIAEGGTVLDTARIYGFPTIGASEEVLGQWLCRDGHRDKVVLMSKGGHPHVTSMHRSRMSQADMEADLTASLRALRTDVIDVYFYHRDDTAQSVGELLERMEGFRREGKIRFYACSNWSAERMRQADAYAADHGLTGFIGNECLYNLASTDAGKLLDDTMLRADSEMIAFHRSGTQNIMMPYSGLCEGFFHKLLNPGVLGTLPLRMSPYYTDKNLLAAKRISELREKYHATISQVLAGWFTTLDFPALPLFGCSSENHLAELFAARDIPFTPEDFDLTNTL